ncbi:MAG: hypothetical protein Q7T87_05460 [Polaromonas sp.]|nr:hypothetical protein [Polaromonas sp.]
MRDDNLPTPPLPGPPQGLPEGRFAGPSEFAALIRTGFAAAAREGWRDIIISDATFEDWPLGERAVAESLHAWSRSGRRLTMLAANYDAVVRRHARFVTWRRTWAHIVDCRGNSALAASDFPSAFWSPAWVFHRLDLDRSTGMSGAEPARRVRLKEQLSECLLKSSPAFPATTLGI